MKQILIGLSLGAVFMCGWIAIFAQSGAQVNPPPYDWQHQARLDERMAFPKVENTTPKTHWVNEARVKNSTVMEQYLPIVFTAWLGTNKTDVEFGLCEDGSVVWRKVKTAQ